MKGANAQVDCQDVTFGWNAVYVEDDKATSKLVEDGWTALSRMDVKQESSGRTATIQAVSEARMLSWHPRALSLSSQSPTAA